MKNFLRVTVLAVCAILMGTLAKAQDNYNATTMGEKVYLQTAAWGQNYPFNEQIFTSYQGSTHAKAGCVPTAYAIVMRYHGFPAEGTSKKLYNCQASTYVEITNRTYDWDKMPLTYNSSWTQEQIDEVAKLFSHVLHAVFPSSIGTNATTANEEQTSAKLNRYFNYQLINASYQANFTMEQWADMLRESIDNGCPVPYASNNSGTGDSRHMFVVDGYTSNGYFHFNFGWNGGSNGWFKLNDITPSQGDDYSWNGNSQHYALFNLQPNKAMHTVTASISPAGAGTVAIDGGTEGSTVTAEVMESTYTTLTATANNGYTFSHWSKKDVQVGTEKTLRTIVTADNNDYVANFLTVSTTDRVNIFISYNSNYGTVTYNGNAVQGTGINPYKNSEVTLTATPLDGYVFNGWRVTKGTNNTSHADNVLTFVASDDMSVEANFSPAVAEYTISTSNITPSDNMPSSSSYCSTWTTNDGITLSTTIGSEKAYALSVSNPLLYTKANTESSTENLVSGITYTLTAPDGYTILSYCIKCYSNSSNYSVDVTPEGGSTTNVDRNYNGTISTNVNASSARFTLSSSYAGRAAIRYENFTVTLQKENGGSTPPTPTATYTISATASEGGNVTINGEAVSTKSVTEGSMVTVVATPQAGYSFRDWTNATGTVMSTNATYSFAATGNTSLTANFTKTSYTVTVEATEGGIAYIGQKGTTIASVGYNESVTITAEANDHYEFIKWTDSEGGQISTKASITVGVTTDVTYRAVFQSTIPAGATSLGGKFFRIKEKSSGKYLNIADTNSNEGSTSGVTVVAKNKSSDTQIFLFEESGNGYKLKAQSGNYIKCWEWNANANSTSTADATELSFEPAGAELEYLIKWDNPKRDDYFKTQTVSGTTYVFCDAASSAAAVWVLEEVRYATISVMAGKGGGALIGTETSVTVEHGNSVTLTATADEGYDFVNWTSGTTVVSTEAIYTISNVTSDGVYVANFIEIVESVARVYYRIGYDGFIGTVGAEASRAAGDTQTYTISPSTGTLTGGSPSSEWICTALPELSLTATNDGGTVKNIYSISNGTKLSLNAYNGNGAHYTTTYTISIPQDAKYKLTGYNIDFTAYKMVAVNGRQYSNGENASISGNNLDVCSVAFTVERVYGVTASSSVAAIDINNFTVTIQKVGGKEEGEIPPTTPETPDCRYYIQSEACGVTDKENALLMTPDTGASSIFYYADSKLLSYSKGTYIKEEDGARGLQNVGTSGTATITTTGETSVIAAPSYMHASQSGTTYFVDHCGSNNGDREHNFILEEVESLPVTISQAEHATLFAPVALAIPYGVSAYILKADGITGTETQARMTSLKNGIIPANTGVIIKGAQGTYDFKIVENNSEAKAEAVGNLLEGTVAKSNVKKDAYILANRNGKIGLYPLENNSYITGGTTASFTNNSHKAYLPVNDDPFGELLKRGTGFRFVFDDEDTGIVEIEKESNNTIYNLQGHKLNGITAPGIYIIDGKKIRIK